MFKTILIFCVFIVVWAFSIAEVPNTGLETIARFKNGEHLIRKSSIKFDAEELSMEFELHTIFDTVITVQGKSVKYVIERAVILCPHRTFIVAEQLWYDEKDQQIGGARSAKVYFSKITDFHSKLIDYVCGSAKPVNQKRLKPIELTT